MGKERPNGTGYGRSKIYHSVNRRDQERLTDVYKKMREIESGKAWAESPIEALQDIMDDPDNEFAESVKGIKLPQPTAKPHETTDSS